MKKVAKQRSRKGLYFGGVVALVLAGIAGGMWNQVTSSAPAATLATGLSSYTNADLRFAVEMPSSADVMTSIESPDLKVTYDTLGRIGAVRITEQKTARTQGDAMVVIHVYSTADKLERDHATKADVTMEESMKSVGLTKSTAVVDGVTADVYSGVHAVDGVGGTEYDYVANEVVGDTYSYFIEFENMGTDPNSAQIQKYLASFRTN
jgi:hypothetical protein